jgi:hypothetical protein
VNAALHAVDAHAPMSRDEILGIVEHWQHRLDLGHWRITVDPSETIDDAEANAEIRIEEDTDFASIVLSGGFATWSRDWANKVVVHELLHVAFRDLEEHVKAVKTFAPGPAFDLFIDRYNHECEGVVDRLACRLVGIAGCA